MTSAGADQLWSVLRLPRTEDGAFDARGFLVLVGRGAPAFIAMWGVFWLTGQGIATDRWDVAIALVTAVPLWIAAKAWRLPWWLHGGAASFPLSIAVIALAHGDTVGLVRGAKFAYGAVLLLAVAAWARSPRRRAALGLAVAVLGVWAFVLSWWSWMELGSGPLDLMKGTLDWHNQFAAQMLFGFATGTLIAVLGRGAWSIVAGACAMVCGAGVVMSGSRYGFALACGIVVGALVAAVVVARRERLAWTVGRLGGVVGGALLIPLVLRSPLFFPGSTAGLNPVQTMAQRGGFEASGAYRLDWWITSWKIGLDHPLFGSGLLTFEDQVVRYGSPAQWHPHNEWAYAWAEGGLSGLLPLVLLLVGIAVLVWRSLVPWPGARGFRADPARWGALLAVGAGVADLIVEYDLYYTTLVALLALAGGLAAAPIAATTPRPSALRVGIAGAGLAIAILVAAAALALDPTFEIPPWLSFLWRGPLG